MQGRLLGCTWGSEGQVGTSILEVLQKLVLTVRLLVPVNSEKDMRALSGRSGCTEWRRHPRGQHRFYLQRFPGAEGSGIQGGPGWLLSTPAVRKQGWGRGSADLGATWAEAEGKPERREQQQERQEPRRQEQVERKGVSGSGLTRSRVLQRALVRLRLSWGLPAASPHLQVSLEAKSSSFRRPVTVRITTRH